VFFFFTVVSCRNKSDDLLIKITDPKKEEIKMYWKNETGNNIFNFQSLKEIIEGHNQELSFVMNGGMFNKDFSPTGLYIENGKIVTPLNEKTGAGNFYLIPNGVFYITQQNQPNISTTDRFHFSNIEYATQSGPMLVSNGKINSIFNENSTNMNIRNGVGILSDNRVVFIMSKKKVNFYSFAESFKKLGCKNALYLDGFVSRAYFPEEKWIQNDGEFGVMIGVVKK
jgi:uncharacterized protein YigE (DUF2233 family)